MSVVVLPAVVSQLQKTNRAAVGPVVLRRLWHALDLLELVGEQLPAPLLKSRSVQSVPMALLRPSPHLACYLQRQAATWTLVSCRHYQDERDQEQALCQAATVPVGEAGLPWSLVRVSLPWFPPDKRLVLAALAQLVAARLRRSLTVAQVAQRMGMNVLQLEKLERLDSWPTLQTLQRYAQALALDLELAVVARPKYRD
ncbi:MAG: helix-turn-helix domain-containing protein [Lactobacillus sp.]|jgi:DNA-binding phage protein|nr:helix-turn-helix domain-containing protein [Lactobacillus sp.]MCI2033387.1 helix-turn-helix domain-containing protein [Lactobacillus sp.]